MSVIIRLPRLKYLKSLSGVEWDETLKKKQAAATRAGKNPGRAFSKAGAVGSGLEKS
jgi:hypothetical protein